MDRSNVAWRGYIAALVTPFAADGALDLPALAAEVELFVRQGVHGVAVNGSTGEWASQSPGERRTVAETVVQAAAGRTPVIVAVTHPDLAVSLDLARHAESIGADSIIIPPPPGVRPSPLELRTYFEEVAGATALPAWIYNFPQENATALSVPTIAELSRIPNIVAVKQSSADIRDLVATIEAVGDTTLVFGHMLSRLGMALIAGGLGGDGHFGSGMPLGAQMSRFFEHVWRGELAEAGEIADRFALLMERLRGAATDGYNWRHGGMQAALKAVMNLQGEPGGHPRRPKLPVTDPVALEEMRAALREAGLHVVA